MKKCFLLLLSIPLLFISCMEPVEFFDYNSEQDVIGIKRFFKKESFQYQLLGSYSYNGKGIIGDYIIDDKYKLHIIKISEADRKCELIIERNKGFNSSNSSYNILEGGYYELKYNLAGLSKIKEKNSIHFSSNGEMEKIFSNDTLSVYSTEYNYLTTYFNDKPNVRMYVEEKKSGKLRSDIAFFRKDDSVYLLIFSPVYSSTSAPIMNPGDIMQYIAKKDEK
ncbi:hypothetical protein FUA48_12225 [Flavobacterium alkalisoli]|uniref:Uncharacterized protein n=1 Tax=Flavobacterium alkalisoli TaxID=2602769 RepID=A0A5B9FTN7_9FLAO|nr:hypothetical protein [Flavobacterium alkalisoli]QEE50315.1 hypothetical protein FUA48_12225 [Flavobacterium alkalisoli]